MTAQVQNLHSAINPRQPLCLIEIASQYGTTTVRPIGIVAQTFADIAGTKTLTPATLRNIRKLGYRITIESGGSGRGYDLLTTFIG
jgi:hypothetical protein